MSVYQWEAVVVAPLLVILVGLLFWPIIGMPRKRVADRGRHRR